jgi:hypothetical protein
LTKDGVIGLNWGHVSGRDDKTPMTDALAVPMGAILKEIARRSPGLYQQLKVVKVAGGWRTPDGW